MKRSKLLEIIKEVLSEDGNVTASVGPVAIPAMFAKPGQGKNVATKTAEKLGYKIVERPKRPSHTKGFDYLDENK